MPCKIAKNCGSGASNKIKTRLACILEADESTRMRMEIRNRIIMKIILQEKVRIHYSTTIWFTSLFLCLNAGTHVYNTHLLDIRSTSSNVCTAGALVPSPPCLGEGPHGWVPVDTHSTPVLTTVRRLWVAYVLYEPNVPQEHAQPAHGSGARVQDHDPETSQPAQTTAQWSHWHMSWLLQSRYRHQSVTTTRCS